MYVVLMETGIGCVICDIFDIVASLHVGRHDCVPYGHRYGDVIKELSPFSLRGGLSIVPVAQSSRKKITFGYYNLEKICNRH